MMGCLFAMFAGLFPRLALVMVWVARPGKVDAAFDTWIWPLLGFVFLPFTTLMYVILWRAGGLTGFDWFWIGLAVLFDLGHTATAYSQRRQVPGYPAGAPT
jgi:hypothetical protein